MRRSLLALAVLTCGCASTSAAPALRDVSKTVEQRSGHALRWNQDTPHDREVDRLVQSLLREELTGDAAAELALLRNPSILATYEELSVSQADVVQAGLLKNPRVSAGVTVAEGDRLEPNLLFGVAWSFLDVFMKPAMSKVAHTQLQATKLRVASAVLDLVAQVHAAYFELQGAQQIAAMRRVVAEGAEVSSELTTRQQEAGNLSELASAIERGAYEQIKLDLARSEADVRMAREHLTTLMGLWGPEIDWTISSKLAEPPQREVSLTGLESLAIAQRLDLAALREETQTLAYASSLVRSTRWLPGIDIGAEIGRLTTGRVAVGPNVGLELPIFDQQRAVLGRLDALRRQTEHKTAATAIAARSQVRVAFDRLLVARRAAYHYKTVTIPLREQIVALSQKEYGAMLLGVYPLIQAKQSQISAYREYIEIVRDYWAARCELERAVGGRLPEVER